MSFEQMNADLMSRINTLISDQGIKATHICKVTHINDAYFSRWRKGQKYLDERSLSALKLYIDRFNNK